MTSFHTFVVREYDQKQGSYYGDRLNAAYRGWGYSKTPMYQLFYLVPVEGKVLPSELSGKFTQLILLQKAIDKYLLSNPAGADGLPDIPPPPPPRRLHRKTVHNNTLEGNDLFEASDD